VLVARRQAKGLEAGKAPAYQWFVKDAATDERFMLMTWEERGIYRSFLDHQWLHGSVPSDLAGLHALANSMGGASVTAEHFTDIWPKIAPCFGPATGDPTRLQNEKLERQRSELQKYLQDQRVKGRKGAAKRWKKQRISADGRGYGRPLPNDASAPTSAPAPALPVVKNTTGSRRRQQNPDLFPAEERTQVDSLVTLWNQERRPGPKVTPGLTDARRKHYGAAMRANPNLDDWRVVIRWLNGQAWANAPGAGDHATWRATLDWLTRPQKLNDYLERARLDRVDSAEAAAGTVWDDALACIDQQVTKHTFHTWFKPTRFVREEANRIVVKVPSPMFRDWMLRHHGDTIALALGKIGRANSRVLFVADADGDDQAAAV